MTTVQEYLDERLPFPIDEYPGMVMMRRGAIIKELEALIPDGAPNPQGMIDLFLMGCERRAKEVDGE